MGEECQGGVCGFFVVFFGRALPCRIARRAKAAPAGLLLPVALQTVVVEGKEKQMQRAVFSIAERIVRSHIGQVDVTHQV